MAINESILKKIDERDLKESEKQLLRDVLTMQEHEARQKQYQKQYKSLVSEYLEKEKI